MKQFQYYLNTSYVNVNRMQGFRGVQGPRGFKYILC